MVNSILPIPSIYSLCCGLLRYIRERKPELNIFKDPSFNGFQKTLDSEMKRLTSLGVGVKRHQAEPITVDEENKLWELRLLGDHSPQALLDTMAYLNGMNFALRSGTEHRSLRTSQLELTQINNQPALVYTENFSKNNAGGLAHRKIKESNSSQ